MANPRRDLRASHPGQDHGVLDDFRSFDAVRRDGRQISAEDFGPLAAADREQLEREIAAIERATATLRRAEPGLQSWTSPPATASQQPRPVWLLIGVLWLSTALATLGAVFAISALVG
jgi:hypothetical protein